LIASTSPRQPGSGRYAPDRGTQWLCPTLGQRIVILNSNNSVIGKFAQVLGNE